MASIELLEALLKRHTELVTELHSLYKNYTKAPQARRTLAYLEKTETLVKGVWKQFEASHY